MNKEKIKKIFKTLSFNLFFKSISFLLLNLVLFLLLSLILILTLTSCDPTTLDIYTKINSNSSGTRTIDIAVKTKYLQKGEITLSKSESIYDKILSILPKSKIETFEQEQYTHFKSTVDFDDINFLPHVSIDNFSETPPERFYAKMEIEDHFFYSYYYFYDYVDMKIDDSLVKSQSPNGDFARLASFFGSDEGLLKITYQVKFPVKIIKSNSDLIGDNNIAIWNLKFGQTKNIYIEGKRIKYLTYILLVVLGLIGAFIIFLIVVLSISRRRKRIIKKDRPRYLYDSYFKKDDYFR